MTDQNEENLLTYEVSDETLEIARAWRRRKRTLPSEPALACLNAQVDQLGVINSKEWRHPCRTAS